MPLPRLKPRLSDKGPEWPDVWSWRADGTMMLLGGAKMTEEIVKAMDH